MKDFRLTLISFCTNALFILPFLSHLVNGQSGLSKHLLSLQIDSPRSFSSLLSAHSARGRGWHVKKKNIRQTQTPLSSIDPVTVIGERRVRSILKNQGTGNAEDISAWLSTLDVDGKWPDAEIDYTTACEARRANWPAQDHWKRIVTLAAAWHGGLNRTEQYAQDEKLKSGIYLAMDYWFNRDFPDTACLASGGKFDCPCENPHDYLWNSNWFSNVILIPQFVGETCLLLNDTLSETQRQSFVRMAKRSYEYKVGSMTGASALGIARIGMDQALLTGDIALLADAYARSHTALVITNQARADGIRADGAFGQRDGLLYNGKHGSDFVNQILGFETEAEGSDFAANDTSQAAFGNLIEGSRWMIIRNTATGVLHWDFSALGRFISFPVTDKQATGSIKIDLKSVGDLGESWNSKPLLDFESSLSKESVSANAGNLVGNRMFYTHDYMVHRGQNYVTTVKLWSARTRHTECINSQNPLGFHLADGTTYTYIRGNEYEDIAAAWDWNRLPGITTDYGATPLNCNNTGLLGVKDFVGGASDGKIGIAAMRYTNPVTKTFHFQKAWFFFSDDVQHVMVSGVSSTNAETPAISVLDQRRLSGPVLVNGVKATSESFPTARTLWHGDVGYKFSGVGSALSVDVGQKTGNWSSIGISEEAPTTVYLFSAWIKHQGVDSTSLSYSVFPGTNRNSFAEKARQSKLRAVQSDDHISAVFDEANQTFMAVFWDPEGGSVSFTSGRGWAPTTIGVNANAVVIYKLRSGLVTVSDPSQALSNIQVTLNRSRGGPKTVDFALPSGGLAGSSVTQEV